MPFGRRTQNPNQSKSNRRFEFVGRKKELDVFFDNLDLPSDAPNKKPIISISGVGGIGKTRLLQKIIQNLPSEYIISFIDETDEIGDDIGRLVSTICHNTRKSGKSVNFEKTSNLIARRNEMLGHLQTIKSEIPKGFFELVYSGARLAASGTPLAPIMDLVAPESKVAEILTSVSNRLLQKRAGKDDLALLLEPKNILAKSLVDDMNQIAKGNKPILLFFDTYEVIGVQINSWLLKYLIGENRDEIDCNLHIVFAGREVLERMDERWRQWRKDDLILDLNLEVFSDIELREYIKVNHQEDIDIEELARITSRLPLWLELWSLSGKTLAEYRNISDSGDVTDRLLRSLPSDQHREWVKKASLLPSFNRDSLSPLLGNEADLAYGWLSSQSFVKPSTDNQIKLHDEMSDILKTHVFNSSPETWENSYKTVAGYYSTRADKISENINNNPYRILNLDYQEVVEKFYYHVLQQVDIHFIVKSQFFGWLLEALHYDLSFFNRLSALIEDFNKRVNKPLPDIRASWLVNDYESFRNDLVFIAEKYSISPHQKAIAYNWVGYSFSLEENWANAISYYDKAIELDKALLSVYYDRSEAYAKQGKTQKAKADIANGRKLIEKELFVGRSDSREEFQNFLAKGAAPDYLNKVVLYAKGGIGKTQLLNNLGYFYEATGLLKKRSSLNFTETSDSEDTLSEIKNKPSTKKVIQNTENKKEQAQRKAIHKKTSPRKRKK
jgi:tetratricopeptide (TPR) repeat protein